MTLTIPLGWVVVFVIAGYLARGWDGVFIATGLVAFYAMVVFPIMVAHIARKFKRKDPQ